MKSYAQAWEAEDGTLHKTQEEADRHEQRARLHDTLKAWGDRRGHDARVMMGLFSLHLAHFLYDQGVRFPAPSEEREAA